MYLSYYKLSAKPFQIDTDPYFLWLGGEHREALANLKYGLLESNGYMVLVGSVGTGKTTLINALLQSIDDRVVVADINFPNLDAAEFLCYVARTYDPDARVANKADSLVLIKAFLERANAEGKRVLLVIDEAHRLTEAVLEDIRLLSNMEQGGRSLINIFFVGQTELKRRLLSSHCRALRQRITLFYHLKPLSEAETLQYVTHRLKVAGCASQPFTPQAVHAVYKFSRGYPRLINKLCDRALLTGFVKDRIAIDDAIIVECAKEISLIDPLPAKIAAIPQLASTGSKRFQWLSFSMARSDRIERLVGSIRRRCTRMASKAIAMGVAIGVWVLKKATTMLAFVQKKAETIVTVNLSVAAVLIGATLLIGLLRHQPANNQFQTAEQSKPVSFVTKGAQNETMHVVTDSGAADLISPSNDQSLLETTTVDKVITPPIEIQMTAMLAEGDYQSVIQIMETDDDLIAHKSSTASELYIKALLGRAEELKNQSPEEAGALLQRAVREDPRNIHALTTLGNHCTHVKAYPQAIETYHKVLELDPQKADVLFNLGFIFANIGMYTAAEEMLSKVAAIKPDFTDKALFNLAIVQQKLDKWPESIASLEAAVAFRPENQQAQEYLKELITNQQDRQ